MIPLIGKWIILPVEIKVRELDSRLWLSFAALQRSYGVVIGSMRQVERYQDNLPAGIYVTKDISPGKWQQLQYLNDRRHAVVCQDEETTIASGSYDLFFDQRVSEQSLKMVRYFYTWGAGDTESLIRAYPWAETRVTLTGSPRVDLWRSELRGFYSDAVKRIKRKYGDYVLICSNFGSNNISSDEKVLLTAVKMGSLRDEKAICRAKNQLAYKRRLFDDFRTVPEILSKAFPEERIIVRPHPIEDPTIWQNAISSVPNARVAFEGAITPWLLGAKAIVHNSCTSAVEASVLERPVIAYRPIMSAEFDFEVANSLSLETENPAELIAGVRAVLTDPERFLSTQSIRASQLLQRHLGALDGDLAAERILDCFENINWSGLPPSQPKLNGWLQSASDEFHDRLGGLKRRLQGKGPKRHFHKFPGLGQRELNEKLQRFAALRGNHRPFRTRRLSKDLFAIWTQET